MADNKYYYKVTGWGVEFEFYGGVAAAQVEDLDDLEPDANETLVGDVLVVSDAGTVHEGSYEHPEIKWPSEGIVRPLMLKWCWEIELDSEFDPSKLSFSDSVLVYDGVEYEVEETAPKGEDEPYEV